MKTLISFKLAAKLSLIIYAIFVLFHLAIIIGIIAFNFAPVDFLWGGRMETKEQLLNFEIASLLIMALCYIIVSIRTERLKAPRLMAFSKVAIWILFILFTLNTVGNLLAKTTFEMFFAIVTVTLAVFSLRLAIEK